MKLAFAISVVSGLFETPMTVLTAILTEHVVSKIPFTMSLAVGAMVYVVRHEIFPETHAGNARIATLGLVSRFLDILWLDTSLG